VTVRGVDHVGLTVPDVDAATTFLVEALDAVVLYDTLPADAPPKGGHETDERLGVPDGAREVRVRMLALPGGPGIELFAFDGAAQGAPAVPTDLGWQHVALYVDDLDATLDRVVRAGAVALGAPRPLPGPEAGARNRFVYVRTPWGSTVELLTYPDPQPYEAHTDRRRWHP